MITYSDTVFNNALVLQRSQMYFNSTVRCKSCLSHKKNIFLQRAVSKMLS